MGYSQVAQTTESEAIQFSRGNGVVPLSSSLGSGSTTVQASFAGTYGSGPYAFRATIQTQEQSLIDPDKQYRVTIEEVTE
jgi:hypothetical protein